MGLAGHAFQWRLLLVTPPEVCVAGRALALPMRKKCPLADSDPGLAVQLLSSAEALRQNIQAPVPPTEQAGHEAVVAQLRERLDSESFVSAWAVGQSRSLAEWKGSLLAQSP